MPALAEDAGPPKLDSGDTAWMLTSTALVLMMTIPGLALFYAGMVRKKNVLATMMQSFAITCSSPWSGWWSATAWPSPGTGNAAPRRRPLPLPALRLRRSHLAKAHDTGTASSWRRASTDLAAFTTIPETVYMMFQMTFAIITPALIVGAFADRMKFSALCSS